MRTVRHTRVMGYSDAVVDPAPYQGADRRRRTPQVGGRLRLGQLLWAGNAVLVVGAGLGLALWSSGPSLPLQMHDFLVGITAILVLLAGILTLLRWSLLGTCPTALVGTAFLLLALRGPLAVSFGPALAAGQWDGATGTLPRLMIGIPALYLLLAMSRKPLVDASIRPVRLALVAAISSATATILWAIAAAGHHLPAPGGAFLAAVNAGLCIGWFGAAVTVQRTRRLHHAAGGQWTPVACVGLGFSSALSALVGISPTFLSAADAAALFAAGVAAVGAYADAHAVLAHEDGDRLRLTQDLEATASKFESERFRMEERLHDLRSAVAAVRSATLTLQRYKERLDPDAAHGLEAAILAEYGRLEDLTGPMRDESTESFDLDEVLTPLLVAERSAGSTILTDLGTLTARGDRGKTVAIVQNLLGNARRYAPGLPITVRARRLGYHVLIEVEDAGPGIPESERESVFRRGVRGSTSTGVDGSGLGLFIASRLAGEQGGTLTLRTGSRGGACFVLTLPAVAGAGSAERRERALIA